MKKTRIGLVGAGRMGAALARNFQRNGVEVLVFDPSPYVDVGTRVGDLPALVRALEPPRVVVLCLPAGRVVDETIAGLPLEPGDVLIDASNAHPDDTRRRTRVDRVHHVGLGVSGGPKGAEAGPALMFGGPEAARALVEPLFTRISAKVRREPCLAWFGPREAGHLVKTVHNGIEYAEMQALAEAHLLLRQGMGLSRVLVEAVFESWSRGLLSSFLLDVTTAGLDVVDEVVDRAEGLGTGRWTVEEGLRVGVAVPSIAAAVDARFISSSAAMRAQLSSLGSTAPADGASIDDLANAVLGARIVHLVQGLQLLDVSAKSRGFTLDLAQVTRTWRGGCILRSALLGPLSEVLARQHLLEDPLVIEQIVACLPGWRRSVSRAIEAGIPVPTLSAGLAFVDGLSVERGTAAMIQTQRHLFGSHPVERVPVAEGPTGS